MAIPIVMRAAVTSAHGGPEATRIVDDWPVPVPAFGQVLIRVTAVALNNTDLWSREGAYGTADDPHAVAGWLGVPLSFPLIQGADITGIVVALGPDVDARLLGRRVLVDPAISYDGECPPAVVGSEADGGFAEFHRLDVSRVHDVDDSPLSDAQLACLPIAYGTAMAMIERAECVAGERVLVTGASGGLGMAAVQILRALGCEVVGQTTTAKAPIVLAAGAAGVLVRDNAARSSARNDSDVNGFDVVVDVVGGDQFGEVLDRLRSGGRLVVAGAISGPVVTLDLRRVYLRQRRIIGSTMHAPRHFRQLVALARAGAVDPLVAATFPLSDLHIAQARFRAKDFVGKLVIVP